MAMLEDRRKEVNRVNIPAFTVGTNPVPSPHQPTNLSTRRPTDPPTHRPTDPPPTHRPTGQSKTEELVRFFKTKVEAEDRVAADLYRCSRSPIASESGVASKSRQV